MVFEGILTEVLNTFLGDYIENLDRDQLSVAVWSGNIELRELKFKDSLLDDLNYPIRTAFGYLGKLGIDIPWKQLYTQPIVVTIEDVLLLVVPNTDAEYDVEKGKEKKWEQKQRQLKHLELVGGTEAAEDDPAKAKEPVKVKTTFKDKLIAKLINNIQIDIKNVHVRYEGTTGQNGNSFCFGATLGSLLFKSTDDKFNIKTVDDVCHLIYKLLRLEYLSAYCSPRETKLFGGLDKDQILTEFRKSFETSQEDSAPVETFHILEPLFFTSRIALNPKPDSSECEYMQPKVTIDTGLDAINLRLSRSQYAGVLEFLESMEGLNQKSKYRDFVIPEKPIGKKNSRKWWEYAQQAVLEVDVRPRLRQWSWEHIKEHRERLRQYSALYSQKIKNADQSTTNEKDLEELEKQLDVFNIVLARNQAQFEVNAGSKKSSWWSWLTGQSEGDGLTDEKDIRHRLKQALNGEERQKLNAALGYTEGSDAAVAPLPPTYVALRLLWDLDKASMTLTDDDNTKPSPVAALSLKSFSGKFEQRPTADGLFLKTEVKDVLITGKERDGRLAVIAKPDAGSPAWLQLLYESNPADTDAGVRLHLFVDPVQLKYDADTVNAIVKFFKPPEAVALRQLQAQALLALQALRESTVAKVRDILEHHRYTDFNIDFKAPYFVLLEHGVEEKNSSALIVDFGRVQLGSIAKGGALNPDIASLEDLKDQSYEKYQLEFKDLQIIFAEKGDDWQTARREKSSKIRILQPINCSLQLWNCLIRNHPLLPLGRIFGELPMITVDITEDRLLKLLRLLLTIPLPEVNYTGDLEFSEKARDIAREYRDMKSVQTLYAMKQPAEDGGHDMVVLDFQLTIQEMSISILNKEAGCKPLMRIAAVQLSQQLSLTASEMVSVTGLNDIFVEFMLKDSMEPVKLIKAHRGNDQADEERVVQLTYTSVSSISPDFESKHNCTLARLDAEFSGLEVTVDQKVLLGIADFVETLRGEVVTMVEETATSGPRLLSSYFSAPKGEDVKDKAEVDPSKEQVLEVSTDITATTADEGFISDDKLIHFAMHAVGQVVTVTLADARGEICRSVIEGLDVGFSQKKSSMIIEAGLKAVSLENPDPKALYPMILRTKGDELLSFKATIHTEPIEIQRERGLFSQEIEVTLGGIEFVFLNAFFMDISRFAEQLQGIFSRFSGVAEAASAKTTQAAVDIYEQASRLRLEVDLKAPVVILPQNSQSRNALVFDLGSLRIANQLQADEDALIDHVTLSISSIAFDRVEDYNAEKGAGASFSLFKQPDPTVILLKRNLSFKTDQTRPEIEAEGKLPSLQFALSNVDYQTILDTFTQNFAEGVAPETGPKTPPATPAKSLPPVKEVPEPGQESLSEEEEEELGRQREPKPQFDRPGSPLPAPDSQDSGLLEKPPSSPPVSSPGGPDKLHPHEAAAAKSPDGEDESRTVPRFKFAFDLDSIVASLYWINRPKSRNRPPAASPEATEKLALFELTGLHVDAVVTPDFTVDGKLILKDVNLQDCRGAFDRRISKLLYLRDGKDKPDALVQVKVGVDADGNQSIDVKVAQFEVAVILDFFVEVSEFFTIRKKDVPPQVSPLKQQANKSTPLKQRAKATVESAATTRSRSGSSSAAAIPKSMTIAINVVVDNPTILLIEDPKNLDSKVLLFSTNLKLCMGILASGQSFQASAENFRMFATRYKTRSANPQRILDPADVALQYKHSVDAGQHIGVTCTDIVITITPSVIKLITVTLAGLGNMNLTDELPENPVGVYEHLWEPEPVRDDHWFLQPPDEQQSDDKILSVLEKTEATPAKQLYEGDMFMFDLPSVMVVIEVGEVNRVLPAFLLEARAFGTVRDWTTRMQAKGILYLEMGYYNPKHDMWEPVIEPIDDGKSERPWEVSVEIIRNDISITDLRYAAKQGMNLQRRGSEMSVDTSSASPNSSIADVIPDAAGTDVMQESAALQVNLRATEPLQITITKTGVELIQNVVNLFMEAANKDTELQEASSSAPYVLQNHLGIDVKLQVITPLQFGEIDMTAETDSDGIIQVKSGASREIFVSSKLRKIRKNALHQTNVEQDLKMRLIVAGRTLELSLLKAERHFYFIQNPEDVQRPYRLIVDIVAETSYKIIHLQSSMTITSFLLMPMELQGGFASVDHIGVVDPNQTIFMPIRSVQFDEKAVLAARPAQSELYKQSEKIPIGDILRMDTEEKTFLLQCEPTKLGVDPTLYYIMFCRVVHVKYENTQKFTPNSVEYAVFLRSVITIANVLPYDVSVGYLDAKETRLARDEAMKADRNILDNHVPIPTGGSRPLYTVHPDKHRLVLRLKDYMERDWEGDFVISALKDEFTPCVLSCNGPATHSGESDAQETVVVRIRMLKEDGTIFLTIYSPFWMLNKTGLPLSYRDPVREHYSDFAQPLLYSTSYGNLQEKRKISIKTGTSDWSKKFSPDAVGSNGVVVCKGADGERSYEIGLQIKSSATVVTKIVVFTPYYVLSNVSDKVAIEVRENHEAAHWILLEPKSTVPFWPLFNEERKEKVKEKDKDEIPEANRLVCRIAGTREVSAPFCYSVLQTNLLEVRNKFGGIYVETQVSECNAITTFQPFYPGRVTSKLLNMTGLPVYFKQQADTQFQTLASDCERLFTWPLPFEEKKIEFFFRENNVLQTELDQDDSGTIPVDLDTLYWVSFYHENQRVLLFTEDVELALRVQQSVDLEPTSLELVAQIESIGLSLVNNVSKHEVLYAGIVSGGPTWQWRKLHGNSKRFHTFKGKEARQLENAFQKYKSNVEADIHVDGLTTLEHSNIEVDFSQMLMSKPHHRTLQRVYEDGFWCRVKTSASQYQFHVKLQKLQIDNPNPLSQYPTIFVPVPLPESVGHKPIIEASLIIRQTAHSSVPQYKLIEALIQEVEIRVDQGVINAIVAIIQPEQENGFKARQNMLDNFHEKDGAELRRSLQDTVAQNAGTELPLLFDHFVIHPLKLHISFSMTGAENDTQSALSMSSEWINLFMKTLGVAASEVNDVLIKLATFERMHKTFNQKQIQQQLQSHYVSQLLKQFYTIALGLDILGNPFGLIRGITGGVRDLFYEPYEGAVEGPEEFMSGLGSGVQSLVGKSVGGVLGTAEKLTGSVGRALATVSFDQKFIRNRQREKNRTPTDFPGAMAQSGKALGLGVVQGITGVVKKPLEGAKQEGAVGFIKGIGRGLVGVVVRPTTGIVDFATGSIEAVRRMATSEVDSIRLRPTRHIGPDGIVRPYNLHQAEGQYIFRDIQQKDLKEDQYVTHLVTSRERRHVLLLTTNRVIYLERGEIFHGRFTIDWRYEWDNFMAVPSMTERGIMFPVFESHEKGLKGLLHLDRKDKPRYVFVEDADSGEWFIRKVKSVMESMKEK